MLSRQKIAKYSFADEKTYDGYFLIPPRAITGCNYFTPPRKERSSICEPAIKPC